MLSAIPRQVESLESIVCLSGKLNVVIYDEIISYEKSAMNMSQSMDAQNVLRKVSYREVQRVFLDPVQSRHCCQIPKGKWYTMEVMETAEIFINGIFTVLQKNCS